MEKKTDSDREDDATLEKSKAEQRADALNSAKFTAPDLVPKKHWEHSLRRVHE